MHLRSASQPSPTLVNTFSHFSRSILIATTFLSSNLHRLDPTTTKYTLIMADPDAPNSQTPILAPFLHWIVSDVQPDCVPGQVRNPSSLPPLLLQTKKEKRTHLKTNHPFFFFSLQKRLTVAPYMFPTPLSLAPHLYTFLIYRQPRNYVPPAMLQNLPGLRARFPLQDYVKQNNLTGPIAGNFYQEGLENLLG